MYEKVKYIPYITEEQKIHFQISHWNSANFEIFQKEQYKAQKKAPFLHQKTSFLKR